MKKLNQKKFTLFALGTLSLIGLIMGIASMATRLLNIGPTLASLLTNQGFMNIPAGNYWKIEVYVSVISGIIALLAGLAGIGLATWLLYQAFNNTLDYSIKRIVSIVVAPTAVAFVFGIIAVALAAQVNSIY